MSCAGLLSDGNSVVFMWASSHVGQAVNLAADMVTMVTNPSLCPQHLPTDCQVALKRVSILFNFTKTHSNLPDTMY